MKYLLPFAAVLILATSCKKERCYTCLVRSIDDSARAITPYTVSGCDMSKSEVENDIQMMTKNGAFSENGIMRNHFATGRPTGFDCSYD